MGCGASRSDTHSPSAQPPTAPVQPPPTAVAAAPSKKQLIPPPQPTSSSSKPAKSHPSFTGGPTFVDDLDGIGPSHTSTFGALERKDSNVTTSRRSRASSATSNAARSRSSSALGSRDEVDVAAPLTTAKGLQRASTFTTNGDVFAKLLAERQAQAAASLKSPYLDPNEFSLDLPSADEPVVDLTPLIAGKVSDVRRVQSTLDARVSRSSTEADVTAIEALEKSLSAAKQELLHILTSAPPSISVSGRVVTDQLVALCTDLVQGNEDKLAVELFSMLLRKLGLALRLGDLAFQRAWCHYAAKDGKPRFLVYILQLPGVCAAIANQPTELLHLAVKHERARIPLVQTLLRFAIPLGLHKRKGELEPFWEDFVDTVASCRRVKHIEDQTGRLALVQYLCTTPDVVRVNHERHRKDGLNVFLRACRDGDVDVVDLLLSKGLVTDVNERAKDRDGSTALVLAAMGGHKAVVESLLKTGRVDVLLKVKDKTAYVLAQENFKNPLLIALLRKAQREAEPHASGRETASGASSRRHSVNTSPAAVSVDIPTHPGDASPDFSNLLDATTTIPSPAPKALDPPTNPHDEHDHAELPPSYERGASPALPSVMELFQQLNAAYQKHDMGASEASSVALLRLRQDLASRLSREPSVKVPSASKTLVTDVLDRVVEHGDLEVGATELLRAAALHLDATSFDFRTIADKQEWPLMAARNNSPVMLSILLPAMGELSEETASNVIIAASKSESRLEMVKVLLDNARTWRRQRGTLLPLWQQFFENIGFTTGSSVQEETQKRFTTLDRILKCKDIEIAFEREDPDGYTMFARACAYGELELIEFMIDRRVLTDPNKALSDGTNPLLQAVAGDHVEVVELLLKYKVVDAATFLPGIGTALDAAVRLKRHHRIVDCLRAALGLTSAHHGSGPVPSGTGGRGSRRGSMRLIQ